MGQASMTRDQSFKYALWRFDDWAGSHWAQHHSQLFDIFFPKRGAAIQGRGDVVFEIWSSHNIGLHEVDFPCCRSSKALCLHDSKITKAIIILAIFFNNLCSLTSGKVVQQSLIVKSFHASDLSYNFLKTYSEIRKGQNCSCLSLERSS